jgi:hypothetical protein
MNQAMTKFLTQQDDYWNLFRSRKVNRLNSWRATYDCICRNKMEANH